MPTINVDADVYDIFEKAVEARLGHKRGNKLAAANEAIREWVKKSGVAGQSQTLDKYLEGGEKVDLVDKYLRTLSIINKSPQTLHNYRHTLKRFQKYVGKPVHTVEEKDILNFLEYMMVDRKATNTTRSTYLGQIRAFYNYAYDHQWIASNPVMDIPDIRIERRVNVPLTKKEVENVLKAASDLDQQNNTNRRYWILIKTLYDSQVRVSELTAIRKSDVDFDGQTIKIHGKGSKERIVSISKECAEALRTYSAEYNYDQKMFDYHIVSIQKDVRMLGKLAQLPTNKEFTPRKLRHTGATHWLHDGGKVTMISKQLGHDNIASTMTYLDITQGDVQKDYDEHHPSSRKDKRTIDM